MSRVSDDPVRDSAFASLSGLSRRAEPAGGAVEAPSHNGGHELARLSAQTEELARRVAQLHIALETSVVIEQAKGILAERLAVSIDEAFALLRGAARTNRTRIHELAARVVPSGSTPAEVEVDLRRLSR